MFNSKKTKLFNVPAGKVSKASGNGFLNAGKKRAAVTVSGNGAKKYSTTGNVLVDQFGKLGSYKAPRSFADIERDCEAVWAESKQKAVALIFYIRMITRKVTFMDGTTTTVSQKGAELKHEGIMRMIWLHTKSPETFWNNITLFISAGSWKDIITMLSYDLQYNGWEGRVLDWNKFGALILSGLENSNTSELLKKYLPQIKANSRCKTLESQADNIIGKWIASLLFDNKTDATNYKKYRKLKSGGTAHEWQQLISRRQFDRIDFDKIHGRALHLLVKSKFLKNQGLEYSYEKFVADPNTELKFTGFVHELFEDFDFSGGYYGRGRTRYRRLSDVPQHKRDTCNKQFATLVEKGGEKPQTKFIVVRDTSGSMSSTATGTNMSCFSIGKALALYFSEFLTGLFADHWIEFNSSAKLHKWTGHTPLEKWYNDSSSFVGSTNFQSVINLFAKLKRQGVPEEDFPTGILCISDSEFNPASLGRTNVEAAKDTLRSAGFSDEFVENFVIVLWNLQNSYYGRSSGEKFETYGDVPNVFYFSGYSAAVVSFLTDKIKTPSELVDAALDQELINMVTV